MKKLFFLIPLLVFSIAAIAHAVPTKPEASVWIVPAAAKKGDTAELDALVYNSTIKTVTVSVLFATPTDEIATIMLTLPAGTAKTATSGWTVPAGQTTVTASIIKAVDASQKNVPELLGPIGTVSVGKPENTTINVAGFGVGVKTWFGSLIGIIEPWRVQQADHFAVLRDTTRKALNIDSVTDITKQFERPETPGLPGDKPTTATNPPNATFPIGSYITLLYSSGLAAIFASAAVFYASIVLILFFFLRLFIRLFT